MKKIFILFLFLFFILYQKKTIKQIENMSNINNTTVVDKIKSLFGNEIKNSVKANYILDKQSIKNFSGFISYLYDETNNIIIPGDITINGDFIIKGGKNYLINIEKKDGSLYISPSSSNNNIYFHINGSILVNNDIECNGDIKCKRAIQKIGHYGYSNELYKINKPPSWYRTQLYPTNYIKEFKQKAAMGITDDGGYNDTILETYVLWWDRSADPIFQIIYLNNGFAYRSNSDEDNWEEWNIITREKIITKKVTIVNSDDSTKNCELTTIKNENIKIDTGLKILSNDNNITMGASTYNFYKIHTSKSNFNMYNNCYNNEGNKILTHHDYMTIKNNYKNAYLNMCDKKDNIDDCEGTHAAYWRTDKQGNNSRIKLY